MSMFQLTGKIPNLFRDCSPVVLDPAIRDHYGGKSTGVCFAVGNVAALVTFLEDCRPLPIPLEELTLDMFNATGRFHAQLWLKEQGYDVGNEERVDVLAWSVLSVWKGGKPLRIAGGLNGVTRWVGVQKIYAASADRAALDAMDAGLLAEGWALTNDNGTLTLPPLP